MHQHARFCDLVFVLLLQAVVRALRVHVSTRLVAEGPVQFPKTWGPALDDLGVPHRVPRFSHG